MHELFVNCLLAHMDGVLAQFEATRGIDHKFQKGFARQAIVQTAIEPWFGPTVRIGTGFVINAIDNPETQFGRTSHECDNVLYWPDLMPNLFLGGKAGPSLFPVEGVAAVVEVKSKLTVKELESALDKLPIATTMNLCSGAPVQDGSCVWMGGGNLKFPIGAILAFESEVASSTLREILFAYPDNWDIVCVLGPKGGVFYSAGIINNKAVSETSFPVNSSPRYQLCEFSVLIRDAIQMLHLDRVTHAFQLRPYVSPIQIYRSAGGDRVEH